MIDESTDFGRRAEQHLRDDEVDVRITKVRGF